MTYTKTQWVNNTTPIDENNLNKIEQGIYDNSLVVDAVTNTLNPTDTETYKTAELTEGQITDVIGISDIVIQGNTEQNGTPTPSAPVDVNVVSGSNVVNTSNKNWLKTQRLTTKTLNGITFTPVYTGKTLNYINVNGTATATTVYEFEDVDIGNPSKYISKLSAGSYILSDYSGTSSAASSTYIRYTTNGSTFEIKNSVSDKTFTLSQDCKYIAYIRIQSGSTFSNMKFKPQLEKSSTATTYESHQGKELPLDLPVENLFDGQLELGTLVNGTGVPGSSTRAMRTINYIAVNPNTTYTISNDKDYSAYVFEYDNNQAYISNSTTQITPYTFTTSATTKYIKFRTLENQTANDLTTKFMLEKNIKATPYVPYGTEPIELCKIGDYQDYFYRDNSKGKWYLHKEIGKVILNGTENWNIVDNTQYSNSILRFSTSVENKKEAASLSTAIPDLLFCDKFKISYINYEARTIEAIAGHPTTSQNIALFIDKARLNTEDVNGLKTWLASNNVTVYYVLATVTNTEITDTTLISQLEAIYNSPLYEETNITQENNDLPMILDITACKDNINGIKAFIRK